MILNFILLSSLALASNVLGFEIVELWSDDDEGKLHCNYVHAEESLVKRYPNIITGHYPNHKKEHILSPRVCFTKSSINLSLIFIIIYKSYVNLREFPRLNIIGTI